METESINTIPFIIAPKKIKYLDINLIKLIQYLHEENYKVLVKEMKRDQGKCGDIPYSWVGGSIVTQMSVIPKIIFRFNTIPIKISERLFVDKIILKFI